jgi:hypothetical protein
MVLRILCPVPSAVTSECEVGFSGLFQTETKYRNVLIMEETLRRILYRYDDLKII